MLRRLEFLEMPVSYEIHEKMGLIVSQHHGKTADDEMISTYTKMYEDPNFNPAFAKLIDLRNADSHGRSTDALKSLADLVQRKYAGSDERSLVAIIAPTDLSFGLSRVYNGLTIENAENVAVFRTAAEACEWLDIDPSILDLD